MRCITCLKKILRLFQDGESPYGPENMEPNSRHKNSGNLTKRELYICAVSGSKFINLRPVEYIEYAYKII